MSYRFHLKKEKLPFPCLEILFCPHLVKSFRQRNAKTGVKSGWNVGQPVTIPTRNRRQRILQKIQPSKSRELADSTKRNKTVERARVCFSLRRLSKKKHRLGSNKDNCYCSELTRPCFRRLSSSTFRRPFLPHRCPGRDLYFFFLCFSFFPTANAGIVAS